MRTGQVIKKAEEFARLVAQSGIPVSEVYLYGSYAKGTAHKDSDIDVCVISPKFGQNLISEIALLNKITHQVDDLIEPYPMSPADFSEKYNLLAHEVKTTGIRVS